MHLPEPYSHWTSPDSIPEGMGFVIQLELKFLYDGFLLWSVENTYTKKQKFVNDFLEIDFLP